MGCPVIVVVGDITAEEYAPVWERFRNGQRPKVVRLPHPMRPQSFYLREEGLVQKLPPEEQKDARKRLSNFAMAESLCRTSFSYEDIKAFVVSSEKHHHIHLEETMDLLEIDAEMWSLESNGRLQQRRR